ncbi:Histone acetyltransferase [Tulasnella sp. 331]|nr:Histone acetyltransferase [Tulasnella sp. 331]KAG8872392.1 Histone acetyltransferase [Tulasnella sp. 332]
MAPTTPSSEPSEPAKIVPGGTYTIEDVGVGFKVWVRRPLPGGSEEQRRAEVLSVRDRQKSMYALPIPRVGSGSTDAPEDAREYYIHWVEFNKRLDEWVLGSRLVLTRELEWPKPKPKPTPAATPTPKATPKAPKAQQRKSKMQTGGPAGLIRKATLGAAAAAGALAKGGGSSISVGKGKENTQISTPMSSFPGSPRTPSVSEPGSPTPGTPTPLPRGLKRKAPSTDDGDGEDAEGEDDDGEGEGEMDEDRDAEGSYFSQDADGDPDVDMNDLDAEGEGEMDGSQDGREDDNEMLDANDNTSQSQDVNLLDRSQKDELISAQAVDPRQPKAVYSKEQEIEKLRHGGSMTQAVHEIARVKNLNRLQMGAHEVEAWYFSPYPVEYAHLPVLYICEFCLSYFPSPKMFERHRKKCLMCSPPGNEIYRHEDISFFEIDGKKQLTWCRNLSLLSKCFLDHKTLYYDVQPFLYYVMTKYDSRGHHILGYFSKEKESAEGYNVACILTLPQHQRFGYGKLLIEFSYELSRKEGKLGSPEKPLSDLGLLGYKAYWGEAIVEYLLELPPGEDVTIEGIANGTAITPADIMYTCQAMHILRSSRNQHIICLTDTVKEHHERAMKKRRRRINPEGLKDWKPPVFSRDQLRFGW